MRSEKISCLLRSSELVLSALSSTLPHIYENSESIRTYSKAMEARRERNRNGSMDDSEREDYLDRSSREKRGKRIPLRRRDVVFYIFFKHPIVSTQMRQKVPVLHEIEAPPGLKI